MNVPLTPLDFERRAVRLFGNHIGVVDGTKRFTYREFGDRVSRLANAVRGLDVAPGERVAFLAFNSHQLLEAYYGVVGSGAMLLPLNIRLSPDELAYILNHAEARALFVDPELFPLYQKMKPGLRTLRQVVLLSGEKPDGFDGHDYEDLLANAPAERRSITVDENAPAELFYTSGSTGQPKGVVMTHRNLYLHALNVQAALRYHDSDVQLHLVPLFHVNGWGTPHFVTMMGARHVMLRRFTPADFCRLVQDEKVTHAYGVPAMFNAVLAFPDVAKYDLSSLRQVLIGGAPAAPALFEALAKRLSPTCVVASGYGMTETCPILTIASPTDALRARENEAEQIQRASTTGLPVPGIDLRVVDFDGNEVPPDSTTVGEIVVRSNVVMDGYFRDPAATAEVIVDGWLHTGDMAVQDADGYVTIVDRKKDIIISGGENISSIEVEKALAAHPAVFECAVIAVPDDRWGEVPLAIVALRENQSATAEDLAAHCRTRLASFKIPRTFEFVPALPKGGTGKILKNQLREPHWQGMEKRVH